MNYALAKARAATAYEAYNHAAVALDNARIHERLAEIREQHEPLNGLMGASMGERERLYAVAFYVVVGRMPERELPLMGDPEPGEDVATRYHRLIRDLHYKPTVGHMADLIAEIRRLQAADIQGDR